MNEDLIRNYIRATGLFSETVIGSFISNEPMNNEMYMNLRVIDGVVEVYEIEINNTEYRAYPIDIYNINNFKLWYLESYKPWGDYLRTLNLNLTLEFRDKMINDIINNYSNIDITTN